jgi:LysM repeat protein
MILRRLAVIAALGLAGQAAYAPFVIVRRGDTVSTVAARAHTPARDLAARNGVVDGHLYAGTVLRVKPYSWERGAAGTTYVLYGALCPVLHGTFMNDWGFPREGSSFHLGNDLFAPRNTPIRAPLSGIVSRDDNGLGGHAVALTTTNGTRLYFAHLQRYGASGSVKAGQVIGYVGNSGDAAGGPTHLHFEIHPGGGEAVNPYPTLRAVCR